MSGVARVTAHILLFVLAIIVFYAGLGIGLQHNPTIGSVPLVHRGGHRGVEPDLDTPIAPETAPAATAPKLGWATA